MTEKKFSFKDFLIEAFTLMKAPLLSLLEKQATKVLIATFINSAWMLDFRLWLVKFAVDYLSEHFIKPAIDYFFRKVGYAYEVQDGKHVLNKVINSTDVGEWDDNTDRV